ncbi:Glucosamine 6-phosphate N-acetyltransferase [Entamoeba marina]
MTTITNTSLFTSSYQFPEYKNIKFRPLELNDYDKGYPQVLNELCDCCITKEQYLSTFQLMKTNGTYYIIVGEDITTNRIVLSGTIITELKFIHNCKYQGHIEDIVVAQKYRGLNLGRILIQTLLELGTLCGCYRIILDCKDHVKPFYEKCGIQYKDNCMVYNC